MFRDLKNYERRITESQLGQDGVIKRIFEIIGTTNKYFVGFGERNLVDLSNCYNLRVNGWTGLSMDINPGHPLCKKELITPTNVNDIFKKYDVPYEFDFLSIDVDGLDGHIWNALEYRPRCLSIEYNSNFPLEIAISVPNDESHIWDNYSMFYGISLGGLLKIASKKQYTLVGLVDTLDAFFVANELLDGLECLSPQELFPEPIPCHNPDPLNRPWVLVE